MHTCRLGHVYGALLAEALRAVEKSVPVTAVDKNTPMATWCECRPVVRAAAETAERCARGEAVDEEGWRAVRMALTGLLPACRAAGELDERGQKKLEAAVARTVIRAQAVVTAMLYASIRSPRARRGQPSGRS